MLETSALKLFTVANLCYHDPVENTELLCGSKCTSWTNNFTTQSTFSTKYFWNSILHYKSIQWCGFPGWSKPKLGLSKTECLWKEYIKRIRYLVPYNVPIYFCNSVIQPHFAYCSVVWRNCDIGLCEKLQKLQKRAARIFYASIDKLFQALGWREPRNHPAKTLSSKERKGTLSLKKKSWG